MNDLPKTRFRGQNLTIWNHLTSGKSISKMSAFSAYRITALNSRISEIRKFLKINGNGYIVDDANPTAGKGMGEYSIYYLRKEIE